jgi:hypothetical protein
MKIRPVGAELFHTERWTDGRTYRRTEGKTYVPNIMVAFRNFAKAPKNDEWVKF